MPYRPDLIVLWDHDAPPQLRGLACLPTHARLWHRPVVATLGIHLDCRATVRHKRHETAPRGNLVPKEARRGTGAADGPRGGGLERPAVELTAYVLMAFGAYIALISRRRGILYGWFLLYIAYSVIVRIMPPALDMVAYSAAMTAWPPPLTFYTLREPVVWIGVPFLHYLLNNRIATFLLVDLLTGLIVYRAMYDLDEGDGRMFSMAPAIMTSYVFLLGQQNVWRQHVAFVILLLAVASRARHRRGSIFLFILSFLAHNATALFFGFWIDTGREQRRRYGPLLTFGAVIIMLYALPSLGKSAQATALNTEYLYVALAGAIILTLLYATTGRISAVGMPALLNFLGFAPAVAILASAPFERIAMMFLVLIVIDIQRRHQTLHIGSAGTQHAAFLLLVAPAFIFQSSRVFLFT